MNKFNLNSKQTKLLLVVIASVLVIPIGMAVATDFSCPPNCTGGNENDVITGTDGNQNKGNKIMKGQGGDDLLIGLGGNDRLEGGIGDDELVGDEDIFGSGTAIGDDQLDGAGGADYMTGGGGNDKLVGGQGAGRDQMWGGDGDDELVGGNGGDDMDGGPGSDLMFGGNGPDYMVGGPGIDRLEGGNGADIMFGGDGNDIIISDGDSYVNGGDGVDTCHVVFDSDIWIECETIIEVIASDPTITLNGANPVNIIIGIGTYDETNDGGATCSDPQDGDITGSVIITGAVDDQTPAIYLVDYNCQDSQGNDAPTLTRTVNVSAGDTPVITLNGDASINIIVGGLVLYDELVDGGAVCTDTEDGVSPVTDITGDTDPDELTLGSYTIFYNCTDVSGNAATTVSRTVNIIPDDQVPIITLRGITPITLVKNVGTYDELVDGGADCDDLQDGDIDANIVISGAVDTSISATYTIDYDCSDNDLVPNDAPTVTRTVHVVDGQSPVITLNGANPLNLLTGSVDLMPYNDDGAICSDPEEGNITGAKLIITDENTVLNAAGTYFVTFNCQDSSGNDAATLIRTVQVADPVGVNLGPILTLIDAQLESQGCDPEETQCLTQKNADRVIANINSAQNNFDAGNIESACSNMSQFDNRVNRYIDKDQIATGAGVQLLSLSGIVQAANCQ